MSFGIEHGRPIDVRVIVAFESTFRAYQEALAVAIRILHPDAEVMTIEPGKISVEVGRLDPDLVIASSVDEVDLGGVPAWVELSLDPSRPSRVKLNDDYSEMVNPTLDKLLDILESVTRVS